MSSHVLRSSIVGVGAMLRSIQLHIARAQRIAVALRLNDVMKRVFFQKILIKYQRRRPDSDRNAHHASCNHNHIKTRVVPMMNYKLRYEFRASTANKTAKPIENIETPA
jgi:hypothetical protein